MWRICSFPFTLKAIRSNVTCTVLPHTSELASHFTPMCTGLVTGQTLLSPRATAWRADTRACSVATHPIRANSSSENMSFQRVPVVFCCLSDASLIVLLFPPRCSASRCRMKWRKRATLGFLILKRVSVVEITQEFCFIKTLLEWFAVFFVSVFMVWGPVGTISTLLIPFPSHLTLSSSSRGTHVDLPVQLTPSENPILSPPTSITAWAFFGLFYHDHIVVDVDDPWPLIPKENSGMSRKANRLI